MATKITKKDRFAQIKAIPAVAENADLVAFIDHELELLNRKNAKAGATTAKPTKRQQENADLRVAILDVLEDEVQRSVTAIKADIAGMVETEEEVTNNRISALMGQLVKEHLVTRIKDKKATFFKIGWEAPTEELEPEGAEE